MNVKITKTIAVLFILGIGLHIIRTVLPGISIPENVKRLIFVIPILFGIFGLAKVWRD